MEVRQTELFSSWFARLRDPVAQARIAVRIRRASLGNFGDVKPVGEGVSEMRIDHGPGYRIYFVTRGEDVVVLLAGGDKRTQRRDIAAAQALAQELGLKMSKTKTIPWDAADHLKTDDSVALYLEAAFAEGDPALIAAALGDVARAKGMTGVAAEAGLGRESLYKTLSAEGNPEFATVLKVLRALGLSLKVAARQPPPTGPLAA